MSDQSTEASTIMLASQCTAGHTTRIVVIGAGGTGGRLIPPLVQVMRRGDSLAIVDGDHVEDRNLLRQNFRVRDVGCNKAEVMAQRYRRDGIVVQPYAAMLTAANWNEIRIGRTPHNKLIIMGCVDNSATRRLIHSLLPSIEGAWIDGGNEMRGGQVILSTHAWLFRVIQPGDGREPAQYKMSITGMSAMPQLLAPSSWHCDRCNIDNKPEAKVCESCKQPEASCRDRIDLQTVAVNQLSATVMLNMLTNLLYGVPMTGCGTFFSTLNTMSSIKFASIDWSKYIVIPENTYASS